jgi:hypothetical protein
MRLHLGKTTITNLFASNPTPKDFVSNLFDSTIHVGSLETTRRIRFLNQISGPTLVGWKLSNGTTVVNGTTYYQCRKGPDQWLDRSSNFKDSESYRLVWAHAKTEAVSYIFDFALRYRINYTTNSIILLHRWIALFCSFLMVSWLTCCFNI